MKMLCKFLRTSLDYYGIDFGSHRNFIKQNLCFSIPKAILNFPHVHHSSSGIIWSNMYKENDFQN
jgi:hypothetical protein